MAKWQVVEEGGGTKDMELYGLAESKDGEF